MDKGCYLRICANHDGVQVHADPIVAFSHKARTAKLILGVVVGAAAEARADVVKHPQQIGVVSPDCAAPFKVPLDHLFYSSSHYNIERPHWIVCSA